MQRLALPFFGSTVQVTYRGRPRLAAFSKRKKGNVYAVMGRQKRAVLARDAKALQRMRSAWKVAMLGIQARIEALTEQIARAQAAGLEVSMMWVQRQERYQALLLEIRQQIDAFADAAASEAVAAQRANFRQGSEDAAALVRAAGVRIGFTMLPTTAFENMVGQLSDGSPLRDLFAEMGPGAVQGARDVLAVATAAGDGAAKTAKALREALGKEIDLSRKRAMLIVRTESARAYTTAQRANYEANADVVEASRWVSARDSRTCPLCWAKDGAIIKHGEKVGFHPGCRCALAPVVMYLDTPRKTGDQILTEREAATPGYARGVLGPARYELWKAGKIKLGDLVKDVEHPRWGPGIRARTLDQLERIAERRAAQ